MKNFLKFVVVGLIVMSLSFSPALMGLAKAGGINYEGFSGYRTDNSWGFDEGQTRGIMFNFSFGGPEDYKKNSSLQDVYRNSLTTNQKVGIGLAVVGVFVLLLIANDDDECNDYNNQAFLPEYIYAEEKRENGYFKCASSN